MSLAVSLTIEKPLSVSVLRLHSLDETPSLPQGFPALPTRPGTALTGPVNVLNIRPREWLFCTDALQAQEMLANWNSRPENERCILQDQTDALVVFRLHGKAAPWLLNKLSALDFQQALNESAHCASTRLGHLAVVVFYHKKEALPVFDVIAQRSYQHYLARLMDASSEHARQLATDYGE